MGPNEKQIRKLKKLAVGIQNEADFKKKFSHVKDPQSLALIRQWIAPYLKFHA